MRRQAFGLLVALLWGCSSKTAPAKAEQQGPTSAEPKAPAPVLDAGLRPSKAQAVEVVQRFAERLMAKDLEGAKADLRIPESLSEKQVNYFVRELANGEYLTSEGLAAVLEKDFGPLRAQFGESAAKVAESAQILPAEAFALGDTESAVILSWDGSRFWVAALHELGGAD